MVLCVYVHMQVSAKMSVCVDTLNTTTTFEPLTVFSMNNPAFCQLALKSEPAGSSFCQNGFRQTLEPRTSKLSHHFGGWIPLGHTYSSWHVRLKCQNDI